MRVFVTGGTGYVGRPVIEALLSRQCDVIALQRPSSQRAISFSQVEIVSASLDDVPALTYAMEGVDAVIHLVGIIREWPRRGITMERVHVGGTRNVIQAAKAAGVRKLVYMSALGARADAVSRYHQSKWEAEELVRESEIPYVILRPSVIFGRGGPGPHFVGQLADLVLHSPLVPVIGHGAFPLQPVSIQTIATACALSVQADLANNRTYEVGGSDVITYEAILRLLCEALERPFRPVRIPFGLMLRVVPLLQTIPAFPLTMDQLQMLAEGNVCKDSDTFYQDFELDMVPFHIDLDVGQEP